MTLPGRVWHLLRDGSCAHRNRRPPAPRAQPRKPQPRKPQPRKCQPREPPARDASPDEPDASPADASPWRAVGVVPSPRREPDGSWSSPLTPKPAPRSLGPTQARPGRASGPGFQPNRSAAPAGASARPCRTPPGAASPSTASPSTAGPSPWQRSHQLWSEAGIQWEQRPAWPPPQPPQYQRPAPPSRPPTPPRPAAARPTRPEPPGPAADWSEPAADWSEPAAAGWPERVGVGGPGPMRIPLGAPVFSDPGVDENDGPDRHDRWGDDRPPIWERPAGLLSSARTRQASQLQATDTLLLDPSRGPAPRAPACSAAAPRRSRCRPSCWWRWPSWRSRC